MSLVNRRHFSDLRHGSITDIKQDFVPLPSGVEYYAMASHAG